MAKSADVVQAIKDAQAAGWTLQRSATGYLVTSPASEVDHVTPANIPDRWWSGKTYRKFFQLQVAFAADGKVIYVGTRIARAPWVDVAESRVSLTRAIEFLRTDHGAE